ncbi:MAG: aminotransferase class V-fold PLP-dependent enzyme [Cyanobacteria bacterium HKST-UBA02]|nr:aminotransferase class V-fold PLP-dependent enzyme [Cyanobacteria bacterium HKST-UBA02]
MKRIYFDNAATSFPKPEPVFRAIEHYLRHAGNPGRGGHSFSLAGARAIFEARESIAEFLGIAETERLLFTPGCTESINIVLKGLVHQGTLGKGDRVVTTNMEHNSVMRPLTEIAGDPGIEIVSVPFSCDEERFGTALRAALKDGAGLCILSRASNVTGELLPVRLASELCAEAGVPLAVDAAQSAGKVEVDLSRSGVTFWCASGHKGLMGPPGVGLLYIAPGAELAPLVTGGTGSQSESYEIPAILPDRFEPGTQPGQNIVGLAAAVGWLKKRGAEDMLRHELNLTQRFHVWADERKDVEIFGPSIMDGTGLEPGKMPLVAFRIRGLDSNRVADALDSEYGIAVRSGLHCAYAAHESLGTEKSGLVRASFGPFNTMDEVEKLIASLAEIAARGGC